MKPFGVKVVTVITGSVETNLFVNAPEHHLPANSRYKTAAKEVAARATGVDVAQHSTPEEFARELVGDILGGASGKVYRGKLASIVRYASTYLPTWLAVSEESQILPAETYSEQDILAKKDTGLEKVAE